MRTAFLLATVMAAVLAIPGETDEIYHFKYEDIDAHEIVNNKRLLKNYAKCFLGQGRCTPDGLEFKAKIPEAVREGCSKCSPKHKELVTVFIRGLQTKEPALWDELLTQKDPKGEYREVLKKFLNESD